MTKRNLPRADIAARPGMRTAVTDKAMQTWMPDLRAAADGAGEATISILDVIGQDFWGEGVTAKRISAALRQIGDRDVTVYINSPGGDFFEGLAIYNQLRDHRGAVTVKILGLAASAASVIAMAGDRIEIGRAGFLMIHNTWIVTMGDRHAIRDVADWLEPFDAASADLYAARTGMAVEDIAKLLDRETWIGGRQAVDDGWADALLSADEVETAPDGDAKAQLRAERRFDLVAARAGMKRSEGRELLAALKGGMPGAAPTGTQDAAVIAGVERLLQDLKAR
ncbi:ATP-dependent protease ClpP, protease subunit [Loktanella atrilutea]|uniref:ATP-dependent Clp protease proteolytic subunit n=1 Tax=Loktanella atrilutea TaxID=366533 RepID=A0A1M5DK59_LOKAT|nr:head maturation protease, ClpP-related [Loktanella atrilutea]SHF67357.1 ATP-dependent protease ClpP, protease subunit [Loktanella atrilutea]